MAQAISKMETTQTAVKFLLDNIDLIHSIKWDEIVEQAKAMEKEQIEVAYSNGSNDRLKNRINEQYYNETYESKDM